MIINATSINVHGAKKHSVTKTGKGRGPILILLGCLFDMLTDCWRGARCDSIVGFYVELSCISKVKSSFVSRVWFGGIMVGSPSSLLFRMENRETRELILSGINLGVGVLSLSI